MYLFMETSNHEICCAVFKMLKHANIWNLFFLIKLFVFTCCLIVLMIEVNICFFSDVFVGFFLFFFKCQSLCDAI